MPEDLLSLLLFLGVLLLTLLRNWRRQRRGGPVADTPAPGGMAPPPTPAPRPWPPTEAPIEAPTEAPAGLAPAAPLRMQAPPDTAARAPGAAPPRPRDRPVRPPETARSLAPRSATAARQAVVAMAVLGPCRGLSAWPQDPADPVWRLGGAADPTRR